MEFKINEDIEEVEFIDAGESTLQVLQEDEDDDDDDIYSKFRGNAIQIKRITAGNALLEDDDPQNELGCDLPPNRFLVSCKEGVTENCNQCNHGAIQMNHLKELDVFIVRSQEHTCGLCKQTFITQSDLEQHACYNLPNNFRHFQFNRFSVHNPFMRNADVFMNNVNIHLDCIRSAYQKKKFRRKFVCESCDFESDHLWNYKRHIMKHGSELPFKCAFCKYATSIKANLEMHTVRNHTKDKLYKCNMCSYKNAVSGRMKEHKYLKHNEWSDDVMIRDKKFKCFQCSYQSDYPGNLKRHESTCRLKASHKPS